MKIGIVHARPNEADMLRRAVGLKPEHHVVWIARTGAEAVELFAKNAPELVLMDLPSCGTNDWGGLRRIRDAGPCAVLVVTDSVHANAARIFEAMGHGALDAVDAPASGRNLEDGAASLLVKIDTISRLIGEKDSLGRAIASRLNASASPGPTPLIAIGASAGGPAALAVLLHGLPRDLPAAIVLVQHVDARFASGMADWLSQHSALPVAVAKEGDRPTAGRVLLAGTIDHLILKTADRLGYTAEPRTAVYRPSIDAFFQSVGQRWRGTALAVLLTGMGKDGALGLKTLRDQGHHTIAQNETTSAVYGMPKAAATLNAAVDILPLEQIASRLVELLCVAK
jgi:two-component system response regulator WspF